MKSRLFLLLFVCVCLCVGSVPAGAVQSPWIAADHMKARLIAAREEGGALDLAVQVQMDPGWHSYWRSPGEAGLPTRFDWRGSQNLTDLQVYWPLPKKFDEAGLVTFGYSGNVVFPVSFVKTYPDESAQAVLVLNAMACKEICVPQRMVLTLDLPAQGVGSGNKSLIDFARNMVPETVNGQNLAILDVEQDGAALTVVTSAISDDDPRVLVELPSLGLVLHDSHIGGETDAEARHVFSIPPDYVTALEAGQDVIVTLIAEDGAVEQRFTL